MSNGVVALIPARGGSKGIPRKAVKMLGDIPVIAWTILAAKNSKSIDKVFVTTEDNEIATVSQKYGAEVLTRPGCLAQNDVQNDEVSLYSLMQLRHERDIFPDTVVLLQPTSPFRSSEDIDNAFELYSGDETVVSCCVDGRFHWALDEEDEVISVWHNPMMRMGRQDIDDKDRLMAENGAIYICNSENLAHLRCLRTPPFTIYLMNELHSVDLDNQSDWDYATWLVETGRVKRATAS